LGHLFLETCHRKICVSRSGVPRTGMCSFHQFSTQLDHSHAQVLMVLLSSCQISSSSIDAGVVPDSSSSDMSPPTEGSPGMLEYPAPTVPAGGPDTRRKGRIVSSRRPSVMPQGRHTLKVAQESKEDLLSAQTQIQSSCFQWSLMAVLVLCPPTRYLLFWLRVPKFQTC
jgi:hypothetical protein